VISKILTTHESSNGNSAAMLLPFLLPSVNKEHIAKKRVGPRRNQWANLFIWSEARTLAGQPTTSWCASETQGLSQHIAFTHKIKNCADLLITKIQTWLWSWHLFTFCRDITTR
jgi:hypothetical protein